MSEEISFQENPIRRPVDHRVKEWEPGLDVVLPIDGRDIPGFKAWVNWHGFDFDPHNPTEGHDGFDFATYLTTDGQIMFGLPTGTPIRAVADGKIDGTNGRQDYYSTIRLTHGDPNASMLSEYTHVLVAPELKTRQEVKKGDVIGVLYNDPEGEEGKLVHLHLTLVNGSELGGNINARKLDPAVLDPTISRLAVSHPGQPNFSVKHLPDVTRTVANFSRVRVNNNVTSM